ncbi:MAG: hypothetical protein OHK93_003114 [Ramalina farinacea]|uniref:Uncharacterized protein n=1 Tax=Ramalina farinacea TaxID=258253 RepID=A0AA43QVZ5_9LECA|nr:hypothetical protein [Ramalina farinacea]
MSAKSSITSAAGTGTSTVASLEPGVQFPNTTTIISSYTGKPIFTGSCTEPQFALITEGVGGMFLEGYTLHTSAIAGATPCVTTPILPLVPPDATSNPEVSVINTQLFSVQYTVIPSHTGSSFPTGAIAGVAVGGFILVSLILGALTLFIRRRRHRDAEARERERMHESSTMRAVEAADGTIVPRSGGYYNNNRSQQQLSELPSPQSAPHSATTFPSPNENGSLWHRGGIGIPPVPELKSASPVPPRELEGDTYIHEHHPAHKVGDSNDSEGFKEAGSEGVGGPQQQSVDEDEEFGVESPVLGRKAGGKE